METLDWMIIGAFAVALVWICISTNRMTKSVAGFLSSERCAGRYLLTIAQSMAFCSAIGTVGGFESLYRNGIGGAWWGMLMMPVAIFIALSGWVAYRYRETRCMTMAQFLEVRYTRRFRIFAGIMAFISGMLNCAVFPMVTARFLIYFLGLPHHFMFLGFSLPTFHLVMLIMVGTGVTLAIAGGQVTIMVTDFLQGVIASAAVIAVVFFVLHRFGWTTIMDTLMASETIRAVPGADVDLAAWYVTLTEPLRHLHTTLTQLNPDILSLLRDNSVILETLKSTPEALGSLAVVQELKWGPDLIGALQANVDSVSLLVAEKYPDMVDKLTRPEGVSMMNPFRLGSLPDFGVPFFIMSGILMVAKTGIWQGGAGYMTAAITPHEAKMGNVLSSWRWLMISLGTMALTMAGYTLVWHAAYGPEQELIRQTVSQITDKHLQSQMFMPIVVSHMLPAGLMGLFAIYMIGASVSTDDSAYHSWGSIFLQDVVMPFRKTPFTKAQHLRYLRWSIVGVGAFALVFSSIWTLKEFIYMWFEITGAIYGGASCAIIGGLYWKRGTIQGAWSGLIAGSVLSLTGIVVKQIAPELTFPGTDTIINGMHVAIFAIGVSYILYITVSMITSREAFNMDQLLHRGKYAIEGEHKREAKTESSWILRKIGITNEFSLTDRIIYIVMILWTGGWSSTFVIGTIYNLRNEVSSETWRHWWAIMLGIQGVVALCTAVWYTLGGFRDVLRLYRKLRTIEVNDLDDGTVHGHHSLADEKLGVPGDDNK